MIFRSKSTHPQAHDGDGDCGPRDSGQVGLAPGGEWIELFRPQMIGGTQGALNKPTFFEPGVIPKSGGLKSPLMCLNQARYGISWDAIGAAMACYDTALQYAKQRKQFRNEPIASHQLVQEKLTWMITEITKAQLLALQVGRLKDQGKAGFQHISMAKKNDVWMALECARMARDILGANGISDDYPIMRHMMNL